MKKLVLLLCMGASLSGMEIETPLPTVMPSRSLTISNGMFGRVNHELSPLHAAIVDGDEESVHRLIEERMHNLNELIAYEGLFLRPVELAIKYECQSMLRALLRAGANDTFDQFTGLMKINGDVLATASDAMIVELLRAGHRFYPHSCTDLDARMRRAFQGQPWLVAIMYNHLTDINNLIETIPQEQLQEALVFAAGYLARLPLELTRSLLLYLSSRNLVNKV